MGLKHVEGLVFFLQKFRLNTLRSLLCYQLKATLKIFKTKKIIELNFPWLIHFYGLRIVDTFLFSAITVQSINQSINLYARNSNRHSLFPLIIINNFFLLLSIFYYWKFRHFGCWYQEVLTKKPHIIFLLLLNSHITWDRLEDRAEIELQDWNGSTGSCRGSV